MKQKIPNWAEWLEQAKGQPYRFSVLPLWNPQLGKCVGRMQIAELIEINDQRNKPWSDMELPRGLAARMLDEIEKGLPPLRAWKKPKFYALWIILSRVIDGQNMLAKQKDW